MASEAKQAAAPDVQGAVGSIASKVPVLEELEGKLKMMDNLHPKLATIVGELNDITNMDDMRAARAGGRLIKRTLDAQAARRQLDLDAEFGVVGAYPSVVPILHTSTHSVHHHFPGHTHTHTTHVIHS